MCEFCIQHGEGKQWYKAMKNYSRDLFEQDDRIEFMSRFVNSFAERIPSKLKLLEKLSHTPLRRVVKPLLTRLQKRDHFGQVVPIEDVEHILNKVDGVVRLSCACRRVTAGQENARYCYGLTSDPRLTSEIDDSFNLEVITPEEAIDSVRKLDNEGLVHSVWTFKTPYIGGLCNCDQDCLAYRIGHTNDHFQLMFRGEYVAGVDIDACTGCRNCMKQCQYGAMKYSFANKKMDIDPRRCVGCGVCRPACHKDAISLHDRSSDPVAANIW